ncbi:MBL fold metallo-hydrolase [Azospirillum sp. ST 5-10]|uniref:MBL fold metallo-hydrolase n=1 Tax=unclassified Azospirillum TaxID=2630922 RepID=UPI003F49C97A
MSSSPLFYPLAEPPPVGTTVEVAPGVLWLRMPLPYALDHVNLYLFEEADGWSVFDTGIGDAASQEIWEGLLATTLGGRPVVRLVVSHYHPDHVGLAGWLHERFAPAFHMTQSEYLFSRLLMQPRDEAATAAYTAFYRRCGLGGEAVEQLLGRGLGYLSRVTGLPPSFERLMPGGSLRMGGRDWRVLTGGGHSPEQALLHCPADRLFLSADQVLAHITPNVSVFMMQPTADPLTQFLDSLAEIRATTAEDTLVLPSHRLPFRGLHTRVAELEAHHAHRCDLILEACRPAPRSCADLVPVLFRRALDAHQLGFAVGEALAHINHLVAKGALAAEADAGGTLLYRSAG